MQSDDLDLQQKKCSKYYFILFLQFISLKQIEIMLINLLLSLIVVAQTFNSARQIFLTLNTTLTSSNYIDSSNFKRCMIMASTTEGLYRVDEANLIEYWNRTDQNYSKKETSYYSNSVIHSIAPQQDNSFLLVLTTSSNTNRYIDAVDDNFNYLGFLQANTFEDISLEKNSILAMETVGVYQKYQHITFTPSTFTTVSTETKTSAFGNKMQATTDKRAYLVWGIDTNVHVYENVSNSLVYRHTIDMNGTNGLKRVCFNHDETLIALESNTFSDIMVIDITSLTNITILNSISPNQTIKGILFMDTYNDILGIFGRFTSKFYSLVNGVYLNNNMAQLAFSGEMKAQYNFNLAQLWFCGNEGIKKYQTSVVGCMDSEATLKCHGDYCSCCPSDCQNCSIAGFCSDCSSGFELDSVKGTCFQVFYSTELVSAAQQAVAGATSPVSDSTSFFLENAMMLLSFTPFMFLFIRSVSFFTIASLYIFLEVPIPKYLYLTIESIYKAINEEVSSYFGTGWIIMKPFTSQLVDSYKAKRYFISSDVLAMNYENMGLFTFVIGFICLMNWIASKMQRDNPLYKVFSLSKFDVLSGQFISMLIGLLLPFKYILVNTYKDFPTKVNLGISYFTSFAALIFPFIYLVCLVDNNRKKERKKMKELLKARAIKIKFPKRTKVLTLEEFDDFYVCLINVSFPMLLLLGNMLYFFVVNFVVLLIGIVKSFYASKMRLNKIIMSFYPLVYHLAFVGLWLFESATVRAVLGITALAVLMSGAVHQILGTFLMGLIFVVKKIHKKCLKKNSIVPQDGELEKPEQIKENEQKRSYITVAELQKVPENVQQVKIKQTANKIQLKFIQLAPSKQNQEYDNIQELTSSFQQPKIDQNQKIEKSFQKQQNPKKIS